MKYTIGIGKYFGIPLRVHATFPLILGVAAADAWRAGTASDVLPAVVFVLAFFTCVVLHEFGHCLQVRRYGISVRDIVLFPFGGVARAEAIPERPRHEIRVAIAGPIVNFAIAAILFASLALAGSPLGGDGFVASLAMVNVVLGTFNLVPAFPMDGGRILRGALAARMPYAEATRGARDVGQLVALVFVALAFIDFSFAMLAVVAVVVFVGGTLEERAVRARVFLAGRRVGDLVDAATAVLAAGDRVGSVTRHVGAKTAPAFAIAGNAGALAGVVSTPDLLRALRDGRANEELWSIARRDFPVAEASMEASRVYSFLRESNKPFAAIVDGDRFVGLFHAADGW